MKKNVLTIRILTFAGAILLSFNGYAQTEHPLNNDFRNGSNYGWVINGSPYTNYTGNVSPSGQATYSSSSIVTEGGVSRVRIVAGQANSDEKTAYRSDFQKQNTKTTSPANKVADSEITIYKQFPVIAIKWNRPESRTVTYSDNTTETKVPGITLDTDLGDFRRASNNDTKIAVSGDIVVSYWDMSKGYLKPGSATGARISALTGAENVPTPDLGKDETLLQGDSIQLAMLQIKIADIKMSAADKAAGKNLIDVFWIKTFASVEALQAYIDDNEPLPVSLTGYTVSLQANGFAQLNWNVASENNNNYFLVERKGGEGDFTEIERVPSKGTGASAYSFIDKNPQAGENYYRLSQVDIDGTKKELGIQSVNNSLNAGKGLTVYQLPVIGNTLSFNYTAGYKTISVSITNLAGKKILEQKLAVEPSGIYEVQLNNKPVAGIYLLTIDGKESQKIVIN